MSQMGKNIIKLVALVFAAAVVVGITEVAVEAFPGEVRRTVHIPAVAQCPGGSGNALAVVSGGKAGFPKIPVLLVTSGVGTVSPPPPATPQSCGSGTNVNLFLLNPFFSQNGDGTWNAALVKTFSTSFSTTTNLPDSGWQALVLRADRGDLLACGTNSAGTVLWSVDFSPFNNPTVPDGRATHVRNGPTGSSCDAIAWDATDKTVFQTPAVGASVFHFPGTGTTTLPPISSGCTTPISGLGIAGTSLFVGCEAPPFEGSSKIRQVDKANGDANSNLVRELFGEFPDQPAGLPDDPTTLASEYKELLWTLDASSAQVLAVEIPGGTLGQLTGVPVLFPGVGSPPNACYNAQGDTPDTDGDGLLDCWETSGIDFDGDGTIDLQLCVMVDTNGDGVADTLECADPNHKDLFVEIDYMQFHKPDPVALTQVVQAFVNAPTPHGPISLHVQVDNENSTSTPPGIPHNNTTALVPCTVSAATGGADYDLLKAQFFGTAAERGTVNGRNAKALAFRYGLFVHNLAPSPSAPSSTNTSTGCAEIGGNDFVVSLGSWGSVNGHNVGTTDQQGGTLLHEFGHTLGLRHGGGDNINCKPNYESVMSYTRQFSSPTGRPLDFSRGAYGVFVPLPGGGSVIGLNKSSLTESAGIGGGDSLIANIKVAYGPLVAGKVAVANGSTSGGLPIGVSWNRDTDTADLGLGLDINQGTSSSGGCPPNQKDAASGQVVTILEGFNDWAHIQFNPRVSMDFGDGSRDGFEQSPDDATSEITLETALALSSDVIDIKPDDRKNTIVRSVPQTVGVAIFSRRDNSVPPELLLDATDIDPATLILRGTGGATWALPVKQNAQGEFQCNTRDVDRDGLIDLVCSFLIPANTLGLQETRVVLEGRTVETPGGRREIHASDLVRVLP